jgi:hypothetical protein
VNVLENKIVVAVRDDLPVNHAVNAAAVVSLSLGAQIPGPLGAAGRDAAGGVHAGLNPHPVPIVIATAEQLADLDARARAREDITAVGFTEVARRERDYEAYLDALAATFPIDIEYVAVGVYGPRNRVSAITKRLPLLGA